MSWQICQNFIRIFVNNMIFSFVLVTFYSLLLGMLLHKYWHNIFVYYTEWDRSYSIFYHLTTDNIKIKLNSRLLKSWRLLGHTVKLNLYWMFHESLLLYLYILERDWQNFGILCLDKFVKMLYEFLFTTWFLVLN